MMLNWSQYQTDILKNIALIGKISPDTVRSYRGLSNAGNKTSLLDAKTRELNAVAVTRQCDGCIIIPTGAAIKQEATREEIVEALGVGVAVIAGATLVYSARVMDAFAAQTAEESPE